MSLHALNLPKGSLSVDRVIQKYDAFMAEIRAFSHSESSKPQNLRVICVSKGASYEAIRTLYQHRGQVNFGENRIDALEEKRSHLHDLDIHWVYMGTCASRQIKRITQAAHEIHSVSRTSELHGIARAVKELGLKTMPVYLQLNCGEPQKRGFARDQLTQLDGLNSQDSTHGILPSLMDKVNITGLMAMPPLNHSLHFQQTNLASMLYYELAELGRQLNLARLSLGMSMDWKAGLRAGATDIRIGKAIFD